MIMKTLYALIISVFLAQFVHAQGIGVNETGADPHPSAMLDVNSNSKGLLPPRMTTAQRDAISSPAEGLQIYNIDLRCLQFNKGEPENPVWICTDGTNCSGCPEVVSLNVSSVHGRNATVQSEVLSDGGFAATRGVCYSQFPNATINNTVVNGGSGIGAFSSLLSGLSYNTGYFVRAFVNSPIGIFYSNELFFTTTAGTYVQFTTVGTHSWEAPADISVADILVVGGGGGGGFSTSTRPGGGGGGGGFYSMELWSLTPQTTYTVVVGQGGSGGTSSVRGAQGSLSQLHDFYAGGGGGGGSANNSNASVIDGGPGTSAATAGGSGGGGGSLGLSPGGQGGTFGTGSVFDGFAGAMFSDGGGWGGCGGGAGGPAIRGVDDGGLPGPGKNSSIDGSTQMYGAGAEQTHGATIHNTGKGGRASYTVWNSTPMNGGNGNPGSNGVVMIRF